MPKKISVLSCIIFLLCAILSIFFKTGAFADGSFIFLEIARHKEFTFIDYARNHSTFLLQFFVIGAIRLGITSFDSLFYIYNAGLVFWAALFYSLSFFYFLNAKNIAGLYLSIITSSLLFIFCGFFVGNESVTGVAIFWLQIAIILTQKNTLSKSSKLLLLLLSVLGLGYHQYFFGYSSILLLALLAIRQK